MAAVSQNYCQNPYIRMLKEHQFSIVKGYHGKSSIFVDTGQKY